MEAGALSDEELESKESNASSAPHLIAVGWVRVLSLNAFTE
jgi:hypothetical protein